jgi:LemA protein
MRAHAGAESADVRGVIVVLGVVVAVVALAALAVARSYNRFVEQRQLIDNSWSNVDTELQRRHDLVPNLVESVRGYAAHERATFDSVISARQAAIAADPSAEGRAGAENQLVTGIRKLVAVAEAYPDLRASAHFLELQAELTGTENRIQAARRIFNGNVRDYNRRIESFPSLAIARACHFPHAAYFELEPLVRNAGAPSVDLVGSGDTRHSGR